MITGGGKRDINGRTGLTWEDVLRQRNQKNWRDNNIKTFQFVSGIPSKKACFQTICLLSSSLN